MADEQVKETDVKPEATELTSDEQTIDTNAEKLLKIEQAEDNAKLRLNKVFGNESTPEEPPKAEESTPTKSGDSTPADNQPADKPVDDEPAEEPAKEEPKADEDLKLTEAELRAAKHRQWSDEDIKELSEANPKLAKKTFAKLLQDETNLSKKFSEIGQTLAKKAVEKTEIKPATESPKKTELKKIDLEKLRKEYENDPIVDIIEAVQANNQTLADELASLKTATSVYTDSEADERVKQAQKKEDEIVAQQIDLFFQSPDVIALKDFYGTTPKEDRTWDNLTQGQLKNRWKIVEEANLIRNGAAYQGYEISVQEALERAHLLVSADVREQAIRNKIKSETKKREKSLTLEPSSSKAVPGPVVKTRQRAEENAGKNLAAVFAK